ncbi:nucleotidyl transferase AbiEii/AbiGii toxin family protein [Proteiniphilum propionicum]|nr:nucleotidyl transferase AbiEii/AbiGii toxin family protein [Proteiniphilum propionicum]
MDSFAIHGGTPINLYILDLPRYSVDVDLTYIPIKPREDSFADIHKNLAIIKEKIKTVVPDIVIREKPNKIYCTRRGVMVKIEVSGTKRGLIDPASIRPLCNAAQNEFETANKARIVSLSQLYGAKITAALDRQHPRDLFDVKLMFDFITNFDQVKRGFLYCLFGGDRPIIESLQPNRVDYQETLVKQFSGMTKIPFSYNNCFYFLFCCRFKFFNIVCIKGKVKIHVSDNFIPPIPTKLSFKSKFTNIILNVLSQIFIINITGNSIQRYIFFTAGFIGIGKFSYSKNDTLQ